MVTTEEFDLISNWYSISALVVFFVALTLVFMEEKINLPRSIPMVLAAGIIWLIAALSVYGTSQAEEIKEYFDDSLRQYTEILLFLIVAMSYLNVLDNRNVFNVLKSRLMCQGWSERRLFWVTGLITFFLSAIADNLTATLLMGLVVMSVSKNKKFISTTCINVVVAANAGGAFSPFGDVTTLMVWQSGHVEFFSFFCLFIPSLVTWFIPAVAMSLTLRSTSVVGDVDSKHEKMKVGAHGIIALFILTVATAVAGHNMFHLPAAYGMLFGLGYLKLFGWYLEIKSTEDIPFDVISHIQEVEWGTLLFFYGVIMSVGGIAYLGYLSWLSNVAYSSWTYFDLSREMSITLANVGVGVVSAFVGNIPVMFSVISMDIDMNLKQWLLVTFTGGVGGSLLATGSAAGVALMGISKKYYTFFVHLRWTPAIVLGYSLGVATHIYLN